MKKCTFILGLLLFLLETVYAYKPNIDFILDVGNNVVEKYSKSIDEIMNIRNAEYKTNNKYFKNIIIREAGENVEYVELSYRTKNINCPLRVDLKYKMKCSISIKYNKDYLFVKEYLYSEYIDGDGYYDTVIKFSEKGKIEEYFTIKISKGNPIQIVGDSVVYNNEGKIILKKNYDKNPIPITIKSAPKQNIQAENEELETISRPGYGHSGKLEPYNESKSLREKMAKYNLTSGWFRWDELPEGYKFREHECPVKELPYLLYSPKNVRDKKVPMVLYFGGLGELGTDLEKQFRQTTVFEKLTSEEFQKKHPSYVFAPMLPENATIRCSSVIGSSNLADLTCDAMYAVINTLSAPAVDTNRLYTTGLSWGGVVSFELACSYPGRFAANVPVSCYQHKTAFQAENPGNYWLLNNDNLYPSDNMKRIFKEIAEMIKERGGEFRYSTFPDEGHDAWTKAWKEDVVWEWMFSKTADGKPVPKTLGATQTSSFKKVDSLDILSTAICTTNIEPIDEKHRPKHAADGLDATCFVSSRLAEKGDYWQIEFAEPIKSGTVCVKSGTRDGRDFYTGGVVEVSRDGKMWTKAGVFSKRNGESNFRVTSPIKYLRVIHTSQKPSQMVLREVLVK